MEKLIIIEGMTCGHCTSSVESALKKIENVSKVSVDLENKSALVEGDNLEDSKLREAIEEIGFDVKEIK